MVGCPGCGSRLVFDIKSQQMKCSYCDRLYPIAAVSKKSKNADEAIMEDDGQMQVTVFTGSQCGAEIIAESDEAVTWCSYCGSPATLESRLSSIRRPDRVIPFKIGKEECVTRYRALAKKQIYAPNGMISQGKAETFRGIYMPFWTYDFTREGSYRFPGKRVETIGNDRITTNYMVSGRLKSRYEGLAHDASLTFDDEVSEKIVPFMQKDAVDFDECYLNGFYANAADQNEAEYRRKMLSYESDMIVDEATKHFPRAGILEKEAKTQLSDLKAYNIEAEESMAMYPVWFLAYRQKDRVSYATMNGQTGKLYADFPASPYKFLLFSLLTALPLFLLFNLILATSPETVLMFSLVCAFIASWMFKNEIDELFRRQCHISYNPNKKKKSFKMILGAIGSVLVTAIMVAIYASELVVVVILAIAKFLTMDLFNIILAAACFVFFIIRFFRMKDRYMSLTGARLNMTNMMYLAVSLGALVMFIIRPVADWYYYVVAFGAAAAVAYSVVNLIHVYNLMASRKPRQFSRSGGDDNA